MSSILLALRQALGLTGRRGFGDWLANARDEATEALVRAFGQPVWGAMKFSAARACDTYGGMTVLAGELHRAFGATPLPVHLVGHSAGSVLHLNWVGTLRGLGRDPHSFQTLAPAATSAQYRDDLGPRSEARKTRCRIYTMDDVAERADDCGPSYGKSLLYLVSCAFEEDGPVPLSGLQRDLQRDDGLLDLLAAGVQGSQREAVVYALPARDAGNVPPRLRSTAQSHGAFDNDKATMEAVLRFVQTDRPEEALVPFPPEAQALGNSRAGGDGSDLPPEVQHFLSLTASAGGSSPAVPGSAPAVPAAARQMVRRALTIGVDGYASRSLDGCENDSNLWRSALIGMAFDVTQCIGQANTTRDQIVHHLKALVASGQPGDLLVWHFSGHGATFEDDGDADDGDFARDQAIIGSFTNDADDLLTHALLDDEIHTILGGLVPGAELCVFLDSCFSGSATRLAAGRTARSLGRIVRPGLRRGGRKLVGRSASPGYDDANHLLFSAATDLQEAVESSLNGQTLGVFSRAVHAILPTLAAGTSNAAFESLTRQALLGETQTPKLYCSAPMRDQPFRLTGL